MAAMPAASPVLAKKSASSASRCPKRPPPTGRYRQRRARAFEIARGRRRTWRRRFPGAARATAARRCGRPCGAVCRARGRPARPRARHGAGRGGCRWWWTSSPPAGHRRPGGKTARPEEPPAPLRRAGLPWGEILLVSRASPATAPTRPGSQPASHGGSRHRPLQCALKHLLILRPLDDERHIGGELRAAFVRMQHRRHDLGGVLERQIAGSRAERRCADVRELPLLRLMQRRQPRARNIAARHRLGLTANHGVNDECGGEVASGRGNDRRADGQLAAQPDAILKLLAAENLQAAQCGCRGVETSRSGTDEGISGERCEIVHDYANHLPDISRERRYIAVASSRRFNRSSTLPIPYSAFGFAGCSSTARSYAVSAALRSSMWLSASPR